MVEIEVHPEVKDREELEEALEKLRNKIDNFDRKNVKSTIAIVYAMDPGPYEKFTWLRAVLITKEPDGQYKTRRFFWARNQTKTYGWRNSR